MGITGITINLNAYRDSKAMVRSFPKLWAFYSNLLVMNFITITKSE